MKNVWRTILATMVFGILAAVLSPAQAQDALEEGPALEFRTNVPWSRVKLESRQSVVGVSPLRVPGPLEGNFWLSAGGAGVETQRGRVKISLDENGSTITSYGGIPFGQSFARSVLFPGHVQLRTRERSKGRLMAAVGATGLALSLWANNDFRGAVDRARDRERELLVLTDSLAIAQGQDAARDARAERDHLEDRRFTFLRATGVVWGVSMLDALLFSPKFRVSDADESSLGLTLARKSRGQAVLRSVIFPGLGQDYNGTRKKGFWIATGGVLAGSYYLWREDDLSRADAELLQAQVRLAANPNPVSEIVVAERRDQVDDATRERDLAVKIALGYWGLSLLDTIISFQEPWGSVPVGGDGGSLGLVLDPYHGGLAAQLEF